MWCISPAELNNQSGWEECSSKSHSKRLWLHWQNKEPSWSWMPWCGPLCWILTLAARDTIVATVSTQLLSGNLKSISTISYSPLLSLHFLFENKNDPFAGLCHYWHWLSGWTFHGWILYHLFFGFDYLCYAMFFLLVMLWHVVSVYICVILYGMVVVCVLE